MSPSKNEKSKTVNIDENLINQIIASEQKINTSIYKIEDRIKTEQELLSKIKEKIKPKPSLQCIEIDKYNFKGFLFSYKTTPDWVNLIIDLLPNNSNKNESNENTSENEDATSEEDDKNFELTNSNNFNKNESDENTDENEDETKDENNKSFELTNSNISFILIKTLLVVDKDKKVEEKITPIKMNMYAMTGGLGYTIISEFIEKNFGLNLVPRLIKTEDNVIRKVVEDRLMGNRIYTSRRNRSNTNLDFETDFSNVYRELEFSADEDILLKLGVIDSNKNKVNKNVVSKDSFKVSTSLNIGELNTLIERLDEIAREDAKFPLNYFTPANKNGFKDSDIKNLFCSLIYKSLTEDDAEDEENFNFEIVGQNIAEYPINSKFELESELVPIDPIEEPIKWETIIEKLDDEELSEEFIEYLFYKSYLITYDENSNETQNIELINCLDGFLKNDNEEVFYLRNGTWYIFNESFSKIITDKYKKVYNNSQDYVLNHIINNYEILKEKWEDYTDDKGKNVDPTESDYNLQFKDEDEVIYADKCLVDKVEIADLIIQEENKLYLFCLKQKFNGSGCRDLYGQIKSSYQIVQTKLKYDIENSLTNYHTNLTKEERGNTIDLNAFKKSFEKSQVYYIAGFLENLKMNTRSNYAKILSLDINNELNDNEFEFIMMDFNFINYPDE